MTRLSKTSKLIIATVGLFVLVPCLLMASLSSPPVATWVTKRQLEKVKPFKIQVDRVDVSLSDRRISVSGITASPRFSDRKLPTLSAKEVEVDILSDWSSLLFRERPLRIKVELQKPVLDLLRGEIPGIASVIRKSNIIEKLTRQGPITLVHFDATDGMVHFRDYRSKKPIHLYLGQISLKAKNVRNRYARSDEPATRLRLEGQIMNKAKLQLSSELKLVQGAPECEGRFSLARVALSALDDALVQYAGLKASDGKVSLNGQASCASSAVECSARVHIAQLELEEMKDTEAKDANPALSKMKAWGVELGVSLVDLFQGGDGLRVRTAARVPYDAGDGLGVLLRQMRSNIELGE